MFNTKSKLQEEVIAKQADLIEDLKEQIKYQEEMIAVLKDAFAKYDKIADYQQATIKDLISRLEDKK